MLLTPDSLPMPVTHIFVNGEMVQLAATFMSDWECEKARSIVQHIDNRMNPSDNDIKERDKLATRILAYTLHW